MKQIAILRKQQNMKQKELAKIVGLRSDTLSRLENGKCSTTMARLHKIAEALNVEVKDLFSEVKENES